MIINQSYTYKLWDGKQVVGTLTLPTAIQGAHVRVYFAPSLLKQIYGKKYETITCPLLFESVDNGVTITTERLIDVRRKSPRQIELLRKYAEFWY